MLRLCTLRLREAHNLIFFRYVVLASVVPLRKGVFVVVDIALFGKSAPVIDSSVAPVFLIHEILFYFFGQLQFVQFVDKVIPVVCFILYGGINPVAVKILCKVDKVFDVPGVFSKRDRRCKFLSVLVA